MLFHAVYEVDQGDAEVIRHQVGNKHILYVGWGPPHIDGILFLRTDMGRIMPDRMINETTNFGFGLYGDGGHPEIPGWNYRRSASEYIRRGLTYYGDGAHGTTYNFAVGFKEIRQWMKKCNKDAYIEKAVKFKYYYDLPEGKDIKERIWGINEPYYVDTFANKRPYNIDQAWELDKWVRNDYPKKYLADGYITKKDFILVMEYKNQHGRKRNFCAKTVPMNDEATVKELTSKALNQLKKGEMYAALLTMMEFEGISIAAATYFLGPLSSVMEKVDIPIFSDEPCEVVLGFPLKYDMEHYVCYYDTMLKLRKELSADGKTEGIPKMNLYHIEIAMFTYGQIEYAKEKASFTQARRIKDATIKQQEEDRMVEYAKRKREIEEGVGGGVVVGGGVSGVGGDDGGVVGIDTSGGGGNDDFQIVGGIVADDWNIPQIVDVSVPNVFNAKNS